MQQVGKTVSPEIEDAPSPWFGVSGIDEECVNLNTLTGFKANFDDFGETAEVTVKFYFEGRGEPREIRMPLNRYDALLGMVCMEY